MLLGFIGAVIYILIGCMLLGEMFYLYANNKTFSAVMEYMNTEDIFDSYGDNYLAYCMTFGLFWPIILVAAVIVYPFMWIKYKYDNVWTTDRKDNSDETSKEI